MSKAKSNTVIIQLMGNDYPIACPPEEETALRASADYLDKQMRTIRERNKVLGLERIAVMAALHLSHELHQLKNTPQKGMDDATVNRLSQKIDESLHRLKQLNI